LERYLVPFERILELWWGKFFRLPIHIPAQIFVTKYSFALSSVTKSYRKYYLENLKISFMSKVQLLNASGNTSGIGGDG
jgi:hypothetical protein